MSSPYSPAEDISVAAIEQSGRSENLINPLQATATASTSMTSAPVWDGRAIDVKYNGNHS